MHGAKVNGRLVPLSYKLKNSDIVEVLSSEKLVKGPSRDWVNIVRSANARSKINAWFKREARAECIEAGKNELTREIERNGFDPSKLLMHRSLETILKRNNFQGIDDMYAAIGYGSISVIKVFSRLRDDYIRSCSEEERAALGYRVTADGNVAYNPKDLPIQLGKFDQSHSKGKNEPAKGRDSSKQVQSYDVDIINAMNADPHQIAVKARSGDIEEQQSRNAKEWDGLLIPKALVSARHFPELVAAVKSAVADSEAASAEFDQFIEAEMDKGDDSDILESDGDEFKVCSDKDLKPKLKTSKTVKSFFELKKKKSEAAAKLKAAERGLDEATEREFGKLTADEIQTLLFDDKWYAALDTAIMGLFDVMLRKFASTLTELAERYEDPLPTLEARVAKSQDEVHAVLREMGFNW